MPEPEEIIPELKKRSILKLLEKNSRIDGRVPDEPRELEVIAGYIKNANGSAYVKLGDTIVVAGVKVEVGEPFPDTPDEGALMVNVEFVPMASPTFEPGPPDENAIEIARVVDRALRSANAVDLKSLCIKEGEYVWIIWCDIYVLNHDGNLMDASSIAALAALMNTKVPKATIDENGKVVVSETEFEPLKIQSKPVTVTVAKIGDKLVVDPVLDEELVMDARITFGVDEADRVTAIQKGIGGYFTEEEVFRAIDVAVKVAKYYRSKVEEAVKEAESRT